MKDVPGWKVGSTLAGKKEKKNTLSMESSPTVAKTKASTSEKTAAEDEIATKNYQEAISALPKVKWSDGQELYFYHHFWGISVYVEGVMEAQHHFTPQPSDVFLCTLPKSGTTWIKALGAAIFTREHLDDPSHPLLNKLPHEIVPFLEVDLYPKPQSFVRDPEIPLVATHIPYQALPESIVSSENKLIYLCRDPKDVFCSYWHFHTKWTGVKEEDANLGEMFESFGKGEFYGGPFWVSMLGYWKASLEFPDKVMFLRYEDLKDEPVNYVKKIAKFMGRHFTNEEEEKGVVEKIVELCSFENLSNLQVNATGKFNIKGIKLVENKSYFRKGKKEDWKNLLTVEMAKQLDKITEEKLSASGLSF